MNLAMIDAGTDPAYFTKAVTQLGENRPVATTGAIFNDRGVKILGRGVAAGVRGASPEFVNDFETPGRILPLGNLVTAMMEPGRQRSEFHLRVKSSTVMNVGNGSWIQPVDATH